MKQAKQSASSSGGHLPLCNVTCLFCLAWTTSSHAVVGMLATKPEPHTWTFSRRYVLDSHGRHVLNERMYDVRVLNDTVALQACVASMA